MISKSSDKPPKAEPKPASIEDATREVYRLLCRGLSRDDILEYAKREKWGRSRKSILDATEAAIARIIETASAINIDLETGKALSRLETLYDESIKLKDFKTALAVQKEINSLLRVGEHARRKPHAAKTPARPLQFKIAR